VHNIGIAAGETVTISRNTNGPWSGDFGFSNDKPGEYNFNVQVDYDNKVAENEEKNNTFSKKIEIKQASSLALIALERAVKSYASFHIADSTIAFLKRIDKLGNSEKTAVLKGVSNGFNTRKKNALSPDNQVFIASLANKFSGENLTIANKILTTAGLKTAESEISKNATIIDLKTIIEAMKFDKKEFSVKAGTEVIINIENPDAMQHNLVIGKPNSLSIIGKAADKMITQADAADKNYVPNLPQIIAASPLINAGASFQLKFTAPLLLGNYPFICTFPGHWRLMNGLMKVVK
jgi:azurin